MRNLSLEIITYRVITVEFSLALISWS